jgi:hypothetical protein
MLMLGDVARILRVINERPNERHQPGSADLRGNFNLWFDGGAALIDEGVVRYQLLDGSRAVIHVVGYFYVTVTLADGTEIAVIEKTVKAGEEFIAIGRELNSEIVTW